MTIRCAGRTYVKPESQGTRKAVEKATKTKRNVDDRLRKWLLLNPFRELEIQRTDGQLSMVILLHIRNLVWWYRSSKLGIMGG